MIFKSIMMNTIYSIMKMVVILHIKFIFNIQLYKNKKNITSPIINSKKNNKFSSKNVNK